MIKKLKEIKEVEEYIKNNIPAPAPKNGDVPMQTAQTACTEYTTVKIIGMGYTPPRTVMIKYLSENGMENILELPIEALNENIQGSIVERVEDQLTRQLNDPYHDIFMNMVQRMNGTELKIQVPIKNEVINHEQNTHKTRTNL